MEKEYYKTLLKKVAYILQMYPSTRNDDIKLWVQLVREFYGAKIVGTMIDVTELCNLPNYADVTRFRRKIQNEYKMYIPTRKEIALKRRWNEQEWLVAVREDFYQKIKTA